MKKNLLRIISCTCLLAMSTWTVTATVSATETGSMALPETGMITGPMTPTVTGEAITTGSAVSNGAITTAPAVDGGVTASEPAISLGPVTTHDKYINGFEDGTVRPSKSLTRAEIEQMLSNLGLGTAPAASEFPISPVISRGTFSDMLIAKISGIKQSDFMIGYPDGSLGLERTLTRAEAVTMINRALGRTADLSEIAMSTDIRVIPDMTPDHWAYYQLLEALTSHTCTETNGTEKWASHQPGTVTLAAGWHNIDGELFYVDENQLFVYNNSINGLSFNENGRYTTGDNTLDALLTAEVKSVVKDSMPQQTKLRALYDYMKANYGYRASGTVTPGTSGWEIERAINMIQVKKGNCYDWAAAFSYMARKVGCNATATIGTAVSPKGSSREHAWIEIMIDYTVYTCDPEIEGVYGTTAGETYDLFMKPYGTAEWQYNRIEIEPENPTPDINDPSIENEPVNATLSAIIDKVYGDVEKPMMMNKTAVTKENEKYYLGTEGLDYKAGVGSESGITAVAHSIVLLEMNEGADIEKAKASIKKDVDGYKWICVGVSAENIRVESSGNYIILIMDNINADKYVSNFKEAMK